MIKHFLQTTASCILILSAAAACSGNKNQSEIPVTEVPANIIDIVQSTLPGIVLSEAEKEVKNDTVIYELEGQLINGKQYEIEIDGTGTIIKIELED